jgi:hypothetical protein
MAASIGFRWCSSGCSCGFHRSAQDVLVGLDGAGDVGVAEPLGDDFDGHALIDQQAAVGVAQVIEPDDGDAGAKGDAFEGLGDGVRMDGV